MTENVQGHFGQRWLVEIRSIPYGAYFAFLPSLRLRQVLKRP